MGFKNWFYNFYTNCRYNTLAYINQDGETSQPLLLEKHAQDLLTILNLKDRAHHKPNALSGGEQQRVAVARALINNPPVLLADEPSGNLDSKNADDLHQLLLNLNKEMGQSCIIVTHNTNFADMADRKLTMVDGMIIK